MSKVIGLSTVAKVDDDDSGSVFTSFTQAIEVQRPSRTREMVENTSLEDTLATQVPGIEVAGQCSLLIYSDPGSTQDTLIGTLITNKTQCLTQLLYADAGTETFDSIYIGYEPEPITRGEMQKVRVTLQRMGASTFA